VAFAVALEIVLQLALQDIGQLTYIEPRLRFPVLLLFLELCTYPLTWGFSPLSVARRSGADPAPWMAHRWRYSPRDGPSMAFGFLS
jgi:hypothetical protein